MVACVVKKKFRVRIESFALGAGDLKMGVFSVDEKTKVKSKFPFGALLELQNVSSSTGGKQ